MAETDNDIRTESRPLIPNAIQRRELLFSSFRLKTRRRPRVSALLKLQSQLLPRDNPGINLICEIPSRQQRTFLSWTSSISPLDESIAPESVPESLFFHCEPRDLTTYKLYAFQRREDIEILYWDGADFHSAIAGNPGAAGEQLLALLRRFRLNGPQKVLADLTIPTPRDDVIIELVPPGTGYLRLDQHSPIRLVYSSLQDRIRSRESRQRARWSNRLLNILILVALAWLGMGLAAWWQTVRDGRALAPRFRESRKLADELAKREWSLENMYRRLAAYPDHLNHLKRVSAHLAPEGLLTSYMMKPDRLEIQGLSPDSLSLVKRLRSVNDFKSVRLRDPVRRRPDAGRERFNIEIILE